MVMSGQPVENSVSKKIMQEIWSQVSLPTELMGQKKERFNMKISQVIAKNNLLQNILNEVKGQVK